MKTYQQKVLVIVQREGGDDRAAKTIGVSQNSVERWRRGKAQPQRGSQKRIDAYLKKVYDGAVHSYKTGGGGKTVRVPKGPAPISIPGPTNGAVDFRRVALTAGIAALRSGLVGKVLRRLADVASDPDAVGRIAETLNAALAPVE